MIHKLSRRDAFAGALALAAAGKLSSAESGNEKPGKPAPFKLGVASYSLRKLSRADAIKGMETLRVRYINIKDFHAPMTSTPAELAQIRKDFESAGITILGVGNVSFKDDDALMRRNFEYAKGLGAPVMVMAPTKAILPRIEKLVKEFDIKAAIHNHGPEDKNYPAPADVLRDIKGMDARMGLCVDVGHTTRTGTDVVQSIKEAGNRVHDVHLKDLANLMDPKSLVAVGDGKMPIPAIFRQLVDINFKGGAMLEYEIHADAPIPGMIQSFAYMRGVLAGLGYTEA